MSMTIQSSVKDNILATPSETSKVENAPAEVLRNLDKQMEKIADDGCTLWIKLYSKYEYKICYHPGKANVVIDALRMKERVKPIRVRAMAITIQYGVTGMILAAQSEAFKQENGMMRTVVMDEAHASRYLVHPGADKTYYNLGDMYCLRYLSENEIESPWILSVIFQDNSKEWNSGDDQLRFRWMIYLVVLADAAESVSDAIRFEYCLASSSGWTNIRCAPFEALYGRKCRSPVLWAEIGESSLIGPELVQETTNKVVLIKEKLKAARDRQKSCADNRRKPLEFEVGDRVMLKVSPWKGVIRFGKKGKLAPRYVGPFEILERIGPVAYRLRLPEELSGIEVDKTLRFVEEPVENSDYEVMRLKCSRMVIVKVRFWLEARSLRLQAKLLAVRYLVKVSWNSKGNFELTWVWEDYLKDKYPRLIVWLVKPLVLTYESVVMYGLCVYMRYVDCVRVGNQSIERDHLIGIGLVMDLVKFLSFTIGGKEMIFFCFDVFALIVLPARTYVHRRLSKIVKPHTSQLEGIKAIDESQVCGLRLSKKGGVKLRREENVHDYPYQLFYGQDIRLQKCRTSKERHTGDDNSELAGLISVGGFADATKVFRDTIDLSIALAPQADCKVTYACSMAENGERVYGPE
ncbi:hypothetical protein Tco_1367753 [Tanacetum coccineum]